MPAKKTTATPTAIVAPTTEVIATPNPEPAPAPVTPPAAAKPIVGKDAVKKPAKSLPVKPATAVKSAPVKKAALPAKKVDAKPVKAAKPVKVEKPKKPKLVRDSYTMPENEYALLASLKKRLLAKGVAAKKSELLRAGLTVLSEQSDAALAAQIAKLTPIKTGRPAK